MAQGDVVFFDQALVDILEGLHDLETDSFNLFLTDGTTTLAATTADPRYGAGGTTNLLSEEVATGGNYAAGGAALANPAVTLTGGLAQFDTDDPATWAQNAGNPTNATYAVIRNATDAGNRCLGFVDIGGVFNMTTGDLDINVNALGWARLDQG